MSDFHLLSLLMYAGPSKCQREIFSDTDGTSKEHSLSKSSLVFGSRPV